jgi:sortase A
MSSPRIRGWIEFALFGAGFLLLGSWAALTFSAQAYQDQAARVVDEWKDSRTPAQSAAYGRRVEALKSGLVGRLEIPTAHMSVIVAEGTDDRTLDHAVGHVGGSALPGEPGNVALVGHRDTYFRGLARVRRGDEIRFVAPDGIHRYRITRTEIVSPRRVDVLDPTRTPALTLVTCFPFHVLGPAPLRFVVHAEPVRTGEIAATEPDGRRPERHPPGARLVAGSASNP